MANVCNKQTKTQTKGRPAGVILFDQNYSNDFDVLHIVFVVKNDYDNKNSHDSSTFCSLKSYIMLLMLLLSQTKRTQTQTHVTQTHSHSCCLRKCLRQYTAWKSCNNSEAFCKIYILIFIMLLQATNYIIPGADFLKHKTLPKYWVNVGSPFIYYSSG